MHRAIGSCVCRMIAVCCAMNLFRLYGVRGPLWRRDGRRDESPITIFAHSGAMLSMAMLAHFSVRYTVKHTQFFNLEKNSIVHNIARCNNCIVHMQHETCYMHHTTQP